MNSSDPPLSPLEEKLTRYVDGLLSPEEAAAFEREHPEAIAERSVTQRLSQTLRTHTEAPSLQHADFFNHQILREIEPPHPVTRPSRWSLFRLTLAGATCLLVAFATFRMLVPAKSPPRPYLAQIMNIKAGDPGLSADVIESDGMTVVWMEGLDFLPDTYTLE